MSIRLGVGLLSGSFCLMMTSLSWAQCSKDTDCKGERVCEEGVCVAPKAPAPAPAAPPASVSPAAAPAVSDVPATGPPEPEPARNTEVVDTRRKYQRHSTGMMVGGIVMVSFVPIALLAAWVADLEQTSCERGNYYDFSSGQASPGTNCDRFDPTIYGGLISAGVLMGVGVPMIVIGGKREPLGTARLTPWATPRSGGLSLRLDL